MANKRDVAATLYIYKVLYPNTPVNHLYYISNHIGSCVISDRTSSPGHKGLAPRRRAPLQHKEAESQSTDALKAGIIWRSSYEGVPWLFGAPPQKSSHFDFMVGTLELISGPDVVRGCTGNSGQWLPATIYSLRSWQLCFCHSQKAKLLKTFNLH